jgi:group I intron endonuclease
MANSAIYSIKNITTEQLYIGSAVNFDGRKNMHLSQLRKNTHGNSRLQKSFNKYGESSFLFNILEPVIDVNLLIKREQYYIDTLLPFFNIAKIAGSSLGIKRTDEFKKKIGLTKNRLGKLASDETKKNISIAQKKRYESIEERNRMSLIFKGNTFRKGKKHKKESILKLSGENSVNSKLKLNQVLEIREKYIPRVYSSYKLAKEYNISRQQVNRIINNIDWKI